MKKTLLRATSAAILAALLIQKIVAAEIYQTPENYIKDVLVTETPPSPQAIWLTKKLRQDIQKIMGYNWGSLRVRYWQTNNKIVWILEEIGKHELITVGITTDQQHIEDIKVLIYREPYGGEVRFPQFTKQFQKVKLSSGHSLNKNIDGITGATLSVNALKRLAKLALLLTKTIHENKQLQ